MTDDQVDRYEPDSVSPPGSTIRELLSERGMTERELAQLLQTSEEQVDAIVRGAAPITVPVAQGLSRIFDLSAAFWMAREAAYRRWQAAQAALEDRRRRSRARRTAAASQSDHGAR
jgi:addiction module HigA family antidote